MSSILGVLGLTDRDATVDTVGQKAVFEAVNAIAQRQEEEMQEAYRIFVEDETTDFKEVYYMPGGGRMQESNVKTRPAAVKPLGSWETAYDLKDLRDQIAWDDVSWAYMSVGKMEAALQTVMVRHTNSIRYEILQHLLNNVNATFVDPIRGSLTIRRLANAGDSAVLYPPVIGSETEATDDHYLESGYATASISDTNNPYTTIKDELEEHFGMGNIVVFINPAERPKTEALTAFVPRTRMNVVPGDNTAVLTGNLPSVPGKIIGSINDVLVSEWRWMPAKYMLGIDLDAPAPLKARVDGPASLRGFKLVAKQNEFPLEESFWRHRIGFGVGNRLNGVVMETGTGGSYTVPTGY